MGLFKRHDQPNAGSADPQEALRLAREALAKQKTFQDATHDRRRRIDDEARAELDAKLARAQERAGHGGAAAPDVATQLERLAALHAAGSLSDEEFAAAKARLLG